MRSSLALASCVPSPSLLALASRLPSGEDATPPLTPSRCGPGRG